MPRRSATVARGPSHVPIPEPRLPAEPSPRPYPPPIVDGADVLAFRRALRWSQRELAIALGCDPSTVAQWEQGHREPPPMLGMALQAIVPWCEIVSESPSL